MNLAGSKFYLRRVLNDELMFGLFYSSLSFFGALNLILLVSGAYFLKTGVTRSLDSFDDLVECIDHWDGKRCYNSYKANLIREQTLYYDIEKVEHFEKCLNTISENNTDIKIVLAVQNCKHMLGSFPKRYLKYQPIAFHVWLLLSLIFLLSFVSNIFHHSIKNATFNLRSIWRIIREKFMQKDFNYEVLIEKMTNRNLSELDVIKSLQLSMKSDIIKETQNINLLIKKLVPKGTDSSITKKTNNGVKDTLQQNNYILLSPTKKTPGSLDLMSPLSARVIGQNPCIRNTSFKEKENNYLVVNENLAKKPENNLKLGNGMTFNISTTKGKNRWEAYVKEKLSNPKPHSKINMFTKPTVKPLNIEIDVEELQRLDSKSNKIRKTLDIRYEDINWRDKKSRVFKRIFILGRGWVSSKKLLEEQELLGPSSFVSSDT